MQPTEGDLHQRSRELLSQALTYAKEANLCKSGRKVLFLHGMTEDPSEFDKLAMKELIDVE